ncbi:MAG: RrF2 family transcriptional regulator [Acidimicrobiia bacterium]
MKLEPSTRADYAFRALIRLARSDGEWVTAAEITTADTMSRGFLQHVLQDAQLVGLVTSRSGRSGGYSLARRPEDITALQILEAIEGPLLPGVCASGAGPGHWDEVCPLHWLWTALREKSAEVLGSQTLADLVEVDRGLEAGTITPPPNSHRHRHRL